MTDIVEAGPAVVSGTGRTFYRINVGQGTLREYWWSAKPKWTFPLAVLLFRVLRVKSPCSTDDPSVETLAPFELPGGMEAFPAEVRALLEPMVRQMEGLGFEGPVVCRVIDDVLHATETYLVTMRSGEGIGRAHVRVWRVRQPGRVYAFVEFMTPLARGGGVWSLASKPDLEAPPEWRTVRKPGAGAAELWAAHRAEVARAGQAAAPVSDDAEARQVEEAHHAAVREFHLRRGIFAPRTEADSRRVEAIVRAREAMASPGGGAEADVLAEIERMGEKRRSWWGALLVLGVSLLLFVAAGKRPDGDTSGVASTWDMMGIMVGVLFVHELGHYVAMRVFGYRNLRMFFIPFFGAAVSGRHYNVAGWKKVVVSLMGPVPGIVLGVIIGLTGLVLKKALLTKVGLMALILNGFNLLPVLPLDGGWVAHALIFSRNYVLDAAFRLAAAGVMIAGGIYTHQKFLMYIGGASLLALPATLKIARVVAVLRREGVRTTSPDDQTIPPDVARVIIGRVRAAFPKGAQTKLIAQHTVHVFETLNARPPGWLATFGLGTVHVGSFAAALVFAVLLVVAEKGTGFGRFGGMAASVQPKHVVAAASMRTWPDDRADGMGSSERQTIVATFDKTAAAAGAFDAVRDALPEGASERLFGETVMVSLPAGEEAARKGVLRVMKGRTKDVFVTAEGAPATIYFTCQAPDEATAERIEKEAQAYFGVPWSAHLVPPWASRDGRPAEERARHVLARETFERLQAAQGFDFKDEGIAEISRKIGEARREGDRAEVRRLQKEQMRRFIERRDVARRAIRDEGAGKVDVALADRFLELEQVSVKRAATRPVKKDEEADFDDEADSSYERLVKELAPMMGQVEMTSAGVPAEGAERESTRGGGVARKGVELTLDWIHLRDAFAGAPAIARWLEGNGCREIKYTFDTSGEEDVEP